MTKADFNKRFPKGLNKTIASYEKALHKIMTGEEIDNIIKYAKHREKKNLKELKKAYNAVANGWDDLPIWATLSCIESPTLLKDIIATMVGLDKEKYDGSEEND